MEENEAQWDFMAFAIELNSNTTFGRISYFDGS